MSTGWNKTMSTALLAAFAVGAVGLGLALVLNWIAGASYSPWTNYISDLSVGAGGSSIVFIVQMVLLALLTCWFFVGSAPHIKTTYGSTVAVNLARTFGILGSIDIVVMVFFPLDPSRQAVYTAHIVTGVVVFVCMAAYLGSYARVFRSGAGLFRIGSAVAGLGAASALVFAVLLFLTELVGVLSPAPVIYLVEWVAFLFFALWMLLTGIQLRRGVAPTA